MILVFLCNFGIAAQNYIKFLIYANIFKLFNILWSDLHPPRRQGVQCAGCFGKYTSDFCKIICIYQKKIVPLQSFMKKWVREIWFDYKTEVIFASFSLFISSLISALCIILTKNVQKSDKKCSVGESFNISAATI